MCKNPCGSTILLGLMAPGVSDRCHCTIVGLADLWLGVVRKKLGLSFLGVTRPTEHLIVADIEMTGLSSDVSATQHVWSDPN